MVVAAAGGKKGFDPSKVIVSEKTLQPGELEKAADNSSGRHLKTKQESSVLPEAATHRLCRTSKQRDSYDELYDTLENLKPRGLPQKETDGPPNRNVMTVSPVHVPTKMTIRTPASEQEQGDGYLALYERSQSNKLSKKEIFFAIWGLLVIIFVLIKAFRWLMA